MPVTTPPAIAALPTPPDPNDRATFNARAYPWSVAQQTFATEVSAVATNVAANATDAAASATAADLSKTAASGSATAAAGSATSADAARIAAQAAVASIPAGAINDTTTTTTSVWSSTKTAAELATKQATLVSGTNIKTINGNPLPGSGNVVIPSGALVYLGAVTASGAATVDVTGLDTYGATYDRLVLIASDVRASVSNNELVVTMQDSGTWRTSGHVYNRTQRPGPGSLVTAFSLNMSGNANIPLCLLTGNVAADYASLRLDIHKPSATCRFEWTASSKSGGASSSFEYVFGFAEHVFALAPLQGLRFALTYGGNITGTFRLYGIANS